jgi:hypothetical protein
MACCFCEWKITLLTHLLEAELENYLRESYRLLRAGGAICIGISTSNIRRRPIFIIRRIAASFRACGISGICWKDAIQRAYCAVQPPSIGIAAPVMLCAVG